MARAKKSQAAQILSYFENAPVGEAALIFDLVADRMKSRKGPVVATVKKLGRPVGSKKVEGLTGAAPVNVERGSTAVPDLLA